MRHRGSSRKRLTGEPLCRSISRSFSSKRLAIVASRSRRLSCSKPIASWRCAYARTTSALMHPFSEVSKTRSPLAWRMLPGWMNECRWKDRDVRCAQHATDARLFCRLRTGGEAGDRCRGIPCARARIGCCRHRAAGFQCVCEKQRLAVRLARRLILFLAILPAWPSQAQDLRVRLYTLHPPTELTVKAASDSLQWRTCTGCPKNSTVLLSVHAAGSELRIQDAGVSREIFLSGAIRMEAPGQPPISANFPVHIQANEGHLFLTATIAIEDYVAAVLAGERGDFRNDESLKAMAVVVRTYATRFRGQHSAEGFDFCDTTHCQVPSWNDVSSRISAAADFTRGEILLFQGAAASAFYYQNCGGTTAASREVWPSVYEPYLRTHSDPYCVAASSLKWESSISISDLDAALRAAGLSAPAGWTGIEIVSRSESGRAQRLRLRGGASSDTLISASSFRYAVNRALGWNKIRSDLYNLRNDGDHSLFSGRGSGHGVGLCQAGAEEMARQGKDYRQILDFYFPGTHLSQTYADDWQKRTSERFELVSTSPEEDSALLPVAEKILKEDENAIGCRLSFRARLQVFQ